MAVLYVTEFSDMSYAGNTDAAHDAPVEPALADQTVAIGVGSTQSNAFTNRTRFVRLNADAVCSVKFGTNPTASATTARLAANVDRIVGVPMGASFKVACITNT